jgi:hypothetical protein
MAVTVVTEEAPMTSAERSYRLFGRPAVMHTAGYVGITALADLSGLHNLPAILTLCAMLSICVCRRHTNWATHAVPQDLINPHWRSLCWITQQSATDELATPTRRSGDVFPLAVSPGAGQRAGLHAGG